MGHIPVTFRSLVSLSRYGEKHPGIFFFFRTTLPDCIYLI